MGGLIRIVKQHRKGQGLGGDREAHSTALMKATQETED